MSVRTRSAPSPTGVLHLGSVRTALFCWLYARHHKGQFILHIEDTDRERSTKENVDAILEGMAWLGLDADEGPFYQTERYDRYREVIDQWLEEGRACHCYCSKEELDALREQQMASGGHVRYDGRCRDRTGPREGIDPVVRFKNPLDGKVVVNDCVRGNVVFDNSQLDDLIIARPDGSPTYNFSVIIDDFDMGITHVIRGDDHLNNTPRQMNMLAALGAEPPTYAHLPMILGPDGAKLSKRHGAVDIREYEEQGYLPEAMLNYLVRLGWSHGDQEIFSVAEMIEFFDIAEVNQSASSFNPEMLLHVASSARYCYEDFEVIDEKSVKKHPRPVILEPFKAARDRLADLEHWGPTAIHEVIEEVAADYDINMGKLGQPIRVAVTSGPVSPPIDTTLWLVGQERTIRRMDHAIQLIEARAAASS